MKKIEKLEDMFRSLIKSMREQLDAKNKDVADVHDTLLALPPSLSVVYSPYLEEKFHSLEKCETQREFFFKLNTCWNFIDCDLLKHIINKHGDDELKSKMENYLSELQDFRNSTTVYQLIKTWEPIYGPSSIPKGYKEFVMQLNQDPKECTIQELESLRKDTSRSICNAPLSIAAMILYEISGGSVTVVWIVAEKVIDMLSSSITQLIDFKLIKRYEIVCMALDGCVFYPLNTLQVKFKSLN